MQHRSRLKKRLFRCYILLSLLGLVGVGFMTLRTCRHPAMTTGQLADPTNLILVAQGQTLYERHCASCHGVNLAGQADWQRPLATGGYPAPPHDETGHTWHHPDHVLFEIIKHGGQATAPSGFRSNMPAFKDALTEADIWAVLAYLKSRWPASIRAAQERLNTP